MPSRLIAGAMSGTSADGVDVALVEIDGRGLGMRARLVVHQPLPFEAALRERIQRIRRQGRTELAELAAVGRRISLAYAEAVERACERAGVRPAELDAIAAHGQTLYHAPPDTIQWLDPALIAGRTGCAVISDFRRADCAAGGQGAPLVPFADYLLFRDPDRSRILLNIGGIANLTWLPAGGSIDEVIAFDTGPGNCISDWLCREHAPDGPGYDPGGEMALRGTSSFEIAHAMARCAYVAQRPPKSTDGPAMIAAFQDAAGVVGMPQRIEDRLATACEAVARTLESSLDLHLKGWHERPIELIVSGGGVENRRMMREIEQVLGRRSATLSIRRIDDLGMPSLAKEAVAFALLGAATLDGEPSNVPSATGAARRVVLGSITPRP